MEDINISGLFTKYKMDLVCWIGARIATTLMDLCLNLINATQSSITADVKVSPLFTSIHLSILFCKVAFFSRKFFFRKLDQTKRKEGTLITHVANSFFSKDFYLVVSPSFPNCFWPKTQTQNFEPLRKVNFGDSVFLLEVSTIKWKSLWDPYVSSQSSVTCTIVPEQSVLWGKRGTSRVRKSDRDQLFRPKWPQLKNDPTKESG